METRRRIIAALVALCSGLGAVGAVQANNSGVILHSGKQTVTCAQMGCHADGGGSFGASIGISRLDSSDLTPGSTHSFRVTITATGAVKAGFNLAQDVNAAAADGDLSTTDGTVTRLAAAGDFELLHSSGKSFSGTTVVWDFAWKVPASPGDYQLFVAGIAANGDNNLTGDQVVATSASFAIAAPQSMTPGPAVTGTPTALVTPARTATPGAGIVTPTTTPTASPAGECGDPDGSGMVTVTDGVQALRAAASLSTICTLSTCDVDGNGEISVTDGVNVLRTAAGLSAMQNCPTL